MASRTSRRWTFPFAALLIVSWAGWPVGQQAAASTESDQFIETALRFELDGDNKYRNLMLQAAVHADPEQPHARWLLGELKVNDQWVRFTDLYPSFTNGSVPGDYRHRRDEALDDPQDEIALARWCRQQDLHDRAAMHWRRVFESPRATVRQRATAAQSLDLRPYGGQWLDRDEIAARRRGESRHRKSFAEWEKRLSKWRKHLQGGVTRRRDRALAELRSVTSDEAIPAMESLLSAVSPELALEVVGVLGSNSSPAATDSLVRHALQLRWAAEAAADALKSRPKEDYVPTLLQALQQPLVGNFQIRSSDIGAVPDLIVVDEHARQRIVTRTTILDPRSPAGGQINAGQSLLAAGLRRQVMDSNARRATANARVFAVLERSTGEVLRRDAAAWWQWWDDYNDLYTSDEPKPTVFRQEYAFVPPPPLASPGECFQAGTIVWTELGEQPIEAVQPGDRVVAQDPATGEVALKLVIARTWRPPGTMLRVVINRTEIVSTRGHPFWVNHHGWKMARELEAGQQVHALAGALTVDAVTRMPEQLAAYNLVVQDFATYFVSDRAVLVHDNTGRANNRAVVPGLVERQPGELAVTP